MSSDSPNTHIPGSRSTAVGGSDDLTVGANRAVSIGGASAETIRADRALSIGTHRNVDIGVSDNLQVGGDRSAVVQRNDSTTVHANQILNVGKNRQVTVSKELTVVAKNLVLRGDDSIEIVCGAARLLLKKDGSIVISGKDITVTGSGKVSVKSSSDLVVKGSKVLGN